MGPKKVGRLDWIPWLFRNYRFIDIEFTHHKIILGKFTRRWSLVHSQSCTVIPEKTFQKLLTAPKETFYLPATLPPAPPCPQPRQPLGKHLLFLRISFIYLLFNFWKTDLFTRRTSKINSDIIDEEIRVPRRRSTMSSSSEKQEQQWCYCLLLWTNAVVFSWAPERLHKWWHITSVRLASLYGL